MRALLGAVFLLFLVTNTLIAFTPSKESPPLVRSSLAKQPKTASEKAEAAAAAAALAARQKIAKGTLANEADEDVPLVQQAVTALATGAPSAALATAAVNAPAPDSGAPVDLNSPELPDHPRVRERAVDVAAILGSQPTRDMLCVIVPFRDSASQLTQGAGRTANLLYFRGYIQAWLSALHREFKLIVVEQEQGGYFNKGFLFDVGYLLSYKECGYAVYHDVDQVPIHTANDYRPRAEPTHLCASTSQNGFVSYGSMVGGAVQLSREQFLAVGGYSLAYFGWGREDDDMHTRITSKFTLDRLSASEGAYRALEHQRVKDLDVTPQFEASGKILELLSRGQLDVNKDGVRAVDAEVLHTVAKEPNYEHYIVRIHNRFNLLKPGKTVRDWPADYYDAVKRK